MRGPRRSLSLLAGALALASLLAGCRGAEPSGSVSADGSAAPVVLGPDANGVEKLAPAQILAKAREAALATPSVHYVGSFQQDDGRLNIDTVVRGTTGSGTISVGDLSTEVRRLKSEIYLQGNDAFNRASAGEAGARALSGKWLGGSVTHPLLSEAAKSIDFTVILDDTLAVDGTLRKEDVTVFAGAPVIRLRDDNSYLYVALEGRPYPLAVRGVDAVSERVRLSQWGKKVTVEKPSSFINVSEVPGANPTPTPSS